MTEKKADWLLRQLLPLGIIAISLAVEHPEPVSSQPLRARLTISTACSMGHEGMIYPHTDLTARYVSDDLTSSAATWLSKIDLETDKRTMIAIIDPTQPNYVVLLHQQLEEPRSYRYEVVSAGYDSDIVKATTYNSEPSCSNMYAEPKLNSGT